MSSLIVRPLNAKDIDTVYHWAMTASEGISSLPKDRQLLEKKLYKGIELMEKISSEKLLSSNQAPIEDILYFILEDGDNLLGMSGLKPRIRLQQEVLELNNSQLNWTCFREEMSELCSLYMDRTARGKKGGKLLSWSRFALLAHYPQLFFHKIMAQFRGICDEDNQSPFWSSLKAWACAPYASMNFNEIHLKKNQGDLQLKQIFPQHLPFLKELTIPAQKAIQQPHKNTVAATKIIENLGFTQIQSFDPLDAGPHWQVTKKDLLKKLRITQADGLKYEFSKNEAIATHIVSFFHKELPGAYLACQASLQAEKMQLHIQSSRVQELLRKKNHLSIFIIPLNPV